MKRSDFRLAHRLRVRWVEVDIQKIVFNGHYLMYFDNAVSDYWRALALPYEAAMHQLGGDLYVKKASLEYHASAELDDWLDVCMRCDRVGSSSMTFSAGIFRGQTLLVSGEMVYVYANPAIKKSQPIPDILRQMFQDYEAGQEMVSLRIGDWQSLQNEAAAIRKTVFIEEQQVPESLEWDEEDESAQHVIAVNRMGMTLATGRLIRQTKETARIGRMAVSKVMRGSGLGAQVLHKLIELAQQAGYRQAVLHAQCNAQAFYEKSGFVAQGDVFMEANIPHIEMIRQL